MRWMSMAELGIRNYGGAASVHAVSCEVPAEGRGTRGECIETVPKFAARPALFGPLNGRVCGLQSSEDSNEHVSTNTNDLETPLRKCEYPSTSLQVVAYYLLTYVAELGLSQRKDPTTDAESKTAIEGYLGK